MRVSPTPVARFPARLPVLETGLGRERRGAAPLERVLPTILDGFDR